jgi:hypothetical protein
LRTSRNDGVQIEQGRPSRPALFLAVSIWPHPIRASSGDYSPGNCMAAVRVCVPGARCETLGTMGAGVLWLDGPEIADLGLVES